MIDHDLAPDHEFRAVRYEPRPLLDEDGAPVEGLVNAWIAIDREGELNALSLDVLRDLFLALRKASNDRRVVAIVLTGSGDRAFSSGGNVREYAESYVGRPQEYRAYLRLFDDVVTGILPGILHADKPVVNRVNGLRVGVGAGLTEAGEVARDRHVAGTAPRRWPARPTSCRSSSAPSGRWRARRPASSGARTRHSGSG